MFYLHSEDVAVLLGALEISSIHPRVQMRKVVPWNAHAHGPPRMLLGQNSYALAPERQRGD